MMQRPFSTPRSFLSCALAVAAVFLLCPGAHAAPLKIWHHRSRPLVVGYFPGWGLSYTEPFYVKSMIANHSAKLLDQINYSQGSVAGGHCSVANRKNDLDTIYTRANSVNGRPDNPHSPFRGYFHQLKELKLRYPHLKVLISLEGAPAGFMEGAKPQNRRAFVASCVDTFLRGRFAPGMRPTSWLWLLSSAARWMPCAQDCGFRLPLEMPPRCCRALTSQRFHRWSIR
jgi:chitinase